MGEGEEGGGFQTNQVIGDVDGEGCDLRDVAADELLQDTRQIFVFGLTQNIQQLHDHRAHVRSQNILR